MMKHIIDSYYTNNTGACVVTTDNGYDVYFLMPGFEEEEVKVRIGPREINVRAQDGGFIISRNYKFSPHNKSYSISKSVIDLHNGILHILLPFNNKPMLRPLSREEQESRRPPIWHRQPWHLNYYDRVHHGIHGRPAKLLATKTIETKKEIKLVTKGKD